MTGYAIPESGIAVTFCPWILSGFSCPTPKSLAIAFGNRINRYALHCDPLCLVPACLHRDRLRFVWRCDLRVQVRARFQVLPGINPVLAWPHPLEQKPPVLVRFGRLIERDPLRLRRI